MRILTAAVVLTAVVAAVAPSVADALELDPSFGQGGMTTMPLTAETEQAIAMDTDSRDRIVVAFNPQLEENTILENQDFTLKRFLPDGQLDSSFGTGGSVTTDLGGFDGITDIAIDEADRVTAGGYSDAADAVGHAPLVRYLADGSLDPSFGDGGVARAPGAKRVGSVGALTLDRRGRILTVGSVARHLGVSRYGAAGALDRSFARKNLSATLDYEKGGFSAIEAGPGRRVTVAGSDGKRALVAQLKPDGRLNRRFGDQGSKTFFGPRDRPRVQLLDSSARALALDAEGRLLVAGTRVTRGPEGGELSSNFFVTRLDPRGNLDRTYATRGTSTFNFGCRKTPSACFAFANSIDIDARGRAVVGGETSVGGPSAELGLARLTRRGDLDRSFSKRGRFVASFGPRPDYFRTALDSGGRIVASASADDPAYGLTLARYLP